MTTPRQARYDSLDVWRGLACLSVVVYHAAWYVLDNGVDARVRAAGGTPGEWAVVVIGRFWFGVPVFFVISGYCIAASADAARSRAGGTGRFFARRFRRIYPPLWTALLFAAAVTEVLQAVAWPGLTTADRVPIPDPTGFTAAQWAGSLTLTEEWRPAVFGPPKDYFFGQVWTLCFEEQFYLVVGLLLIVCPRWFFPGGWLVTGLVVLNVADLNALTGGRLGADLNAHQVRIPGLFTEGLWLSFAAGMAVYYRLNRADRVAGVLIEVLLAAATVAAVRIDPDPSDPYKTLPKWTAVACAFAILACRLAPFDAALTRTRWLAPLRFCGRMCYSLYLVHPLTTLPVAWVFWRAGLVSPAVTLLVTSPLAVGLSVGLGYGFYRLVEQRFVNTPAARPPVPPAPARQAAATAACAV
jgi:peptidoglycan/LPS O-acetylase OafA/YrhL